MGCHLFTVTDTFAVRNRGTILTPGFPLDSEGSWRIGDAVVLRRPDGTTLETVIRGIEGFSPVPCSHLPILVPIDPGNIPAGTEVWSAY